MRRFRDRPEGLDVGGGEPHRDLLVGLAQRGLDVGLVRLRLAAGQVEDVASARTHHQDAPVADQQEGADTQRRGTGLEAQLASAASVRSATGAVRSASGTTGDGSSASGSGWTP